MSVNPFSDGRGKYCENIVFDSMVLFFPFSSVKINVEETGVFSFSFVFVVTSMFVIRILSAPLE